MSVVAAPEAMAAAQAPDREAFLAAASALPYVERGRAARALGDRARTNAVAAEIVRALERGDVYERHLAAWTLHGRRDGAAVVARLADPSRLVRNTARGAIGSCSDAEVVIALEAATLRREHLPMLRQLARHRRHEAIDTYLERRAARGDAGLASLLRFASPAFAPRAAAAILARPRSPTANEWQLLVQARPRQACDRLFAIVRAAGALRDRIAEGRLAAALTNLAAVEPDAALARVGPADDLHIVVRGAVDVLASSRPIEVFELCYARGLAAPPCTALVATTLDTAQLTALLEKRPSFFPDFEALTWLRPRADALFFLRRWWQLRGPALPHQAWSAIFWSQALEAHDERERFFGMWVLATRPTGGAIPAHLLRALPADLRAREIAHALDQVPGTRADPSLLIAYARLLPYERMEQQLTPLLAHPEADVRASCLEALVEEAATDDTRLRALERVAARPNERDPVRERLLRALRRWPADAWRPTSTRPLLERIIAATLNARDLGPASRAMSDVLVEGVLAFDPRWSAGRLLERQRLRGDVTFGHVQEVVEATPPHPLLDEVLAELAAVWTAERQAAPLHALFLRASGSYVHVPAPDAPGKRRRVPLPLPRLEEAVTRAWAALGPAPEVTFALAESWQRPHAQLAKALAELAIGSQDEAIATGALKLLARRDPWGGLVDEVLGRVTATWEVANFDARAVQVLRAVPRDPSRPASAALVAFARRAATWPVKALLAAERGEQRTPFVTRLVALISALEWVDLSAGRALAAQLTARLVDHGAVFDAADLLARALVEPDAALEAIEGQVTPAHSVTDVVTAMALLRRHDRARFRRAALRLVETDGSALALEGVADELAWNRQDALPAGCFEAPPAGRFQATERDVLVRPATRTFHRLTRDQQQEVARTLSRLGLATDAVDHDGLSAAPRAAALPCDATAAIALGRSPRPPIRDAALAALGRLDGPDGVPLLLECLEDDRARVAAYALRAVLTRLDPDVALSHLRGAPLTKVTAAKEIVRVTGVLGTEAAHRFLLELERRDLHRDVHIALLRALWGHLDARETWDAYARAAAHEDVHVATSLLRLPQGELTDEVDRHFSEIIALLLRHAKREVRLVAIASAMAAPVRDAQRRVVQALLDTATSGPLDEIEPALGSLLRRGEEVDVPTVAARLPDVQRERARLVPWTRGLIAEPASRLSPPVARGLLGGLAADPLLRALYLRLGARFWPAHAARLVIEDLARRGDLHVDAFAAARALVAGIPAAPSWLDETATTWSADRNELLRRLGLVALVRAARAADGWTAARQDLLRRAMRDPAPLVAGAAELIQAGDLDST